MHKQALSSGAAGRLHAPGPISPDKGSLQFARHFKACHVPVCLGAPLQVWNRVNILHPEVNR